MGKPKVHIGEVIQKVAKERNVCMRDLADAVGCSPKNIYKIFKKQNVNTEVLLRLSIFLKYDFFAEFSKSIHFGEFAKMDTEIL